MKRSSLSLLLLLLFSAGRANNVQVSNVGVGSRNTASHYALVTFTVAWENSWRTSTNESNRDGVWVFLKFKKNSSSEWKHATLHGTGYTAAAGSVLAPTADGKGAFLYRAADGIGPVSYANNQLRWDYGTDGVLDNETVEVKVFALEMVYIPQGSFYLGSGGTENYRYSAGNTNAPYLVNSNNAITKGSASGELNSNNTFEMPGVIPAAYPKGYNAFWIMKYETSQQQLADFLNLLTGTQAASHYVAGYTPLTGTHPTIMAPQPERALTYGNWIDLAALADWSGLRPMSEMEYEKACRGTGITPVANEYAWGTATATVLTAVNNAGASDESVATPADANACCEVTYANATRTGLFARPSSNRVLSGASYFGVPNLSDNVSEICISTANDAAFPFDGSIHGDGNIGPDGQTDIGNWKLAGAVSLASPGGAYGLRGGNFYKMLTWGRVSDRENSSYFWGSESDRLEVVGFRMVRTAE